MAAAENALPHDEYCYEYCWSVSCKMDIPGGNICECESVLTSRLFSLYRCSVNTPQQKPSAGINLSAALSKCVRGKRL